MTAATPRPLRLGLLALAAPLLHVAVYAVLSGPAGRSLGEGLANHLYTGALIIWLALVLVLIGSVTTLGLALAGIAWVRGERPRPWLLLALVANAYGPLAAFNTMVYY